MNSKRNKTILTLIMLTALLQSAFGEKRFRIYIDADWSSSISSSRSIEQGIRLALSEIDSRIGEYELEIVRMDHHGNSRRSTANINAFINDPDALVMFCGLHSPPVLANLELIQNNDVLLLDPWAAAGPITRSPGRDGDNWIFRLSIDDTKAGEIIVSQACDTEGFKRPALLLEDTGWGRSNQRTMTKALEERGLSPVGTFWFDWNTGKNGAGEMLQDIHQAGADVIFFVANAAEGKTFLKAMAERSARDRLPIRSHWGITGGDLFESLGPEILVDGVDLEFLQTSFSFLSENRSPFSRDVFSRLKARFPEIGSESELKAPTGFIHAYDLTRILIQAMRQSELSGGAVSARDEIRRNLEELRSPVQGLIKRYISPFSPYSNRKDSAHEALDISEFTMARYEKDGSIRHIKE